MLFEIWYSCHDLIVNNLFKHHHMRFEPEESQEYFRNDLNRLFPLIRYKKNRSVIYIDKQLFMIY